MRKLKWIIGAFYILQGLGNLILRLYIRVDVAPGGSGGAAAGMEILIKSFLLFVSCLSLLTALTLFLRREDWAQVFGVVSSVLFGMFYGFLAILPVFIVVRLLSLVIVILNVVSFFFLEIENENRQRRLMGET